MTTLCNGYSVHPRAVQLVLPEPDFKAYHRKMPYIRASVDALCRDGQGLISRERVQRGRLTHQRTRS